MSIKITIVGNSVALRVRPVENHPYNRNYSSLILGAEKLRNIENKALGATTVSNWVSMMDSIVNTFPDIYIINIGVVDATVREVPLWFYRLANRKSDTIFTKFCKILYRRIFKKARRLLALLRGKRSWISIRKFTTEFELLIKTLIKETNAKIIVIPINIANGRIERQLPGTKENHRKFNNRIEKITKKYDQYILDISDFQSEKFYPDGVHFNKTGHLEVANRLDKLIQKIH